MSHGLLLIRHLPLTPQIMDLIGMQQEDYLLMAFQLRVRPLYIQQQTQYPFQPILVLMAQPTFTQG